MLRFGRFHRLSALCLGGLFLCSIALAAGPAEGPAGKGPAGDAPGPAPKKEEPVKKEPAKEPAKAPEAEPESKREPEPRRQPEPAPEPEPEVEPQVRPQKQETSRKSTRREKDGRPVARRQPPPVDETGAPLPQELRDGVADAFPPIHDRLLPGLVRAHKVRYLHLGDERPAPVVAPTPSKEEPEGPGLWARLTARFGSDRTLVNVIVLAALVIIFGLYRLRAGRSRYP